jgi:hypothetical protein
VNLPPSPPSPAREGRRLISGFVPRSWGKGTLDARSGEGEASKVSFPRVRGKVGMGANLIIRLLSCLYLSSGATRGIA